MIIDTIFEIDQEVFTIWKGEAIPVKVTAFNAWKVGETDLVVTVTVNTGTEVFKTQLASVFATKQELIDSLSL